MPRYLIHIGSHKTGTTYLQIVFRTLAPELSKRGILYPEQWTASGVSPGHVRLVQRLRAGKDAALAEEFQQLNGSRYELILISAEDLSLLPRDSVDLLRSYLENQQVTIVFYCRRWLNLLPSSWQEIVKHGRSMTLPEFVACQFMDPFASNTINYATRLDFFDQTFGRQNLCLVSYDNIVEQGGNLAEHFFRSFLSWPNAPVIRGIRPNPSLSIQDTEVIRALNSVDPTQGPGLRERYLKMRPQLDLSSIFAAMEGHRAKLWINEHSANLNAVHAANFKKYGGRLIAPRSEECFFVPKQGNLEYIKESYLLADGVREALRGVLGRIRN
jgi:hypothetical protein